MLERFLAAPGLWTFTKKHMLLLQLNGRTSLWWTLSVYLSVLSKALDGVQAFTKCPVIFLYKSNEVTL
jgi:hypothetical protein